MFNPRARSIPVLLVLCACVEPSGPDRQVASRPLEVSDPGTPLAVTIPEVEDPLLANLVVAGDAAEKGMWSATQAWPLNGLHSVLLPNGKVLTYGTPTGAPAAQDGRFFDVWDPAVGFGGASHRTSAVANRVNSFCASAAFLPDGRLLVPGGNGASVESTELAVASGAVTVSPFLLADERWYATMIALPDGRPIIMGGSAPYAALDSFRDPDAAMASGAVSMTPEVYDPATGWRSLFGAFSREAFGPDFNRYWYPRSWVAPNGQVFGISSEKMWYLDPTGDGSVRVAGDFKTGADEETRPNIGPTSAAVMFAPGRILQVGGNGYRDGYASSSSALATVVDIRGDAPVLAETAAMSFPRQWPSATVLPDGRVAVTGGTRFANNGGQDAVFEAELWDPTSGTWTTGARAAQVRVYHSAAILLPNGTVLSTGGGAPGPVNNLNAEVYYPPYLFRRIGGASALAARPVITAVSGLELEYGTSVELDLGSAQDAARVVLVGASSVTHSFNTSQRWSELAFVQSGARIAAALPAAAADAPPGYYLLFVLDAAGVPSRGVLVGLGGTAAPPETPAFPRNRQVKLESANLPGYAVAFDGAGLGVLKPLGADATRADLLSAQYVVRDGLADASCVSFESVAQPGRWLRHAGYRLQLGTFDGGALFRNDATFCPEAGLSGQGVTFRSANFPANAMRHRDYQIWIDPVDGSALFANDASFLLVVTEPPTLPSITAPIVAVGATASYAPAVDALGATYSWDFGDGTPPSTFAALPAASHVFTRPGLYRVALTVRMADGRLGRKTFVQAVHAPVTELAPARSSAVALETPSTGPARLWVINPDGDTVRVFATATHTAVAEIPVGGAPRSLALAPDGRVWVVERDAASISILDPVTLAVERTLTLPRASQPYGIAMAPDGSAAFVSLEAAGTILKLDPRSGALLANVPVGERPRHLSITGDSATLLVSRFVTPLLPGEASADVQPSAGGVDHGGEVVVVDALAMTIRGTVVLHHSDRVDASDQGRGVPNYLGAAVIAPDGASAWVPSKQDNVARGALRDGANLDFQSTVRAVSSRIDLGSLVEDAAERVDHDNAGVASAAAFDPTGAYLFVALETSRQVAVVDPVGRTELFRIEVGRAPQGLVVSSAPPRLYVQNFMDRTVSVVDLEPLFTRGELAAPIWATLSSSTAESLPAQVLRGKQLFYDARDPRLARDAYLSCAACHNDGDHDGRVWDFTGMGEGLRNTIGLRGRAGAQLPLHWSGNFDEVQDFEGQIRQLAQGSGLLSDDEYLARSHPLGAPKAGLSEDLDALAAYVASLSTSAPSPWRRDDGEMTPMAREGERIFVSAGCARCHQGRTYSGERGGTLHDVGTIKPASGARLGGPLTGIDTPSLLDVWATAPYLHDGSAPTIADAIQAHRGVRLRGLALARLVAFLQQLEAGEPACPAPRQP
jgi:YVTN family beta-propeller protein